jgi:hypothetical protein
MTISLEKQLFDSAKAYYEGAKILMKPSTLSASRLLIQPGVTCAALSLKLFLKCILAIEGKDKEDRIYRIAELYSAISPSMEKTILDKFDELSNTKLTRDQLLKHLEALDDAFVKWRYILEEDASSVNIEDLEEMMLATKSAIQSVKADWE